MPILTVTTRYLDQIRAGTKTSTIRTHCRVRTGDRVTFTNYRESVRTRCVHVRSARLDALTEADAQADGFATRAALLQALREHYSLASDAVVWIIAFTQLDSDQRACASAASGHPWPQ